MKVIGWEPIVPELAVFFSVLRRRQNDPAPLNLFFVGAAGTNKTVAASEIAAGLLFRAQLLDAGTIDDVAELAGVVNLKANVEKGESSIIAGDLLGVDVLVLDEFLNVKPHVLSQFRLALQGKLVVYGKQQPMSIRSFIATGNLSEHMQVGEANLLDSPLADRFAMVLDVPGLAQMSKEQRKAVIEGEKLDSFADELKHAIFDIEVLLSQRHDLEQAQATNYVLGLIEHLAGTPLAFEGRRAKLLRTFVLHALALCRSRRLQREDVLYRMLLACSGYHRLCGISLDSALLESAHQTALATIDDTSVDAQIAAADGVSEKIAVVVRNLAFVSAVNQVHVFGQLLENADLPLRLACRLLAESEAFASAPAEVKAMLERLEVPGDIDVVMTPARLEAFSRMSQAQVQLLLVCAGDEVKADELRNQINCHLERWGVPTVGSAAWAA